ncbi:MAG: hypothetical protein HQ506_03000 [Candidatus Marinimicrobia bacterium]|nr:hypothetical protein [Candidatus Neomarinimicrobiota bacterium]
MRRELLPMLTCKVAPILYRNSKVLQERLDNLVKKDTKNFDPLEKLDHELALSIANLDIIENKMSSLGYLSCLVGDYGSPPNDIDKFEYQTHILPLVEAGESLRQNIKVAISEENLGKLIDGINSICEINVGLGSSLTARPLSSETTNKKGNVFQLNQSRIAADSIGEITDTVFNNLRRCDRCDGYYCVTRGPDQNRCGTDVCYDNFSDVRGQRFLVEAK